MDPLSIVASVVGVVAFATSTAQRLVLLTQEIKDAPEEVRAIREDLESFASILKSVEDLCDRYGLPAEAAVLVETLNQSVSHCQLAMETLVKELAPLIVSSSGKTGQWKWGFNYWRRKDIVSAAQGRFRDRIACLSCAVTVLNGHLTGRGQEEIRRDMKLVYTKLLSHFQTLESGNKMQQKLEDDLESVSNYQDRQPQPSLSNMPDEGKRELVQSFLEAARPHTPSIAATHENMPDTFDEHSGLLAAAKMGDSAAIARLAAQSDAQLSERDEEGRTALHFCAIYDDVEGAKALLDHGVSSNVKDNQRRTPFKLATEADPISTGVATLLLERGCALSDFTSTLFDRIKTTDDPTALQPIIEALAKRLHAADRGPYLVHQAIDRNENECLGVLLKSGFDPDKVDNYGVPPIFAAILQTRRLALKILVEHKADVNVYVPKAVEDGMQKDGPVQYHNHLIGEFREGFTPLFLASNRMLDTTTTRYLLENGADPNFVFPDTTVTLARICARYFLPCAKLLVEYGTNVNYKPSFKQGSRYWAICCDNRELLSLMIDKGLDLNNTEGEMDGETALHLAAAKDVEGLVRFLLSKGADPTIRSTGSGETPLELARKRGCNKVIHVLENAEKQHAKK